MTGSSRPRTESIGTHPELGGNTHVHPAKSSPQLNDLLSTFERTSLSVSSAAGVSATLGNSVRWRRSVGNCFTQTTDVLGTKLGPGQVIPKGCRLATPGRFGELKIGFSLQRNVLGIEVSTHT